MLDTLLAWFHQYGYWVVFFGVMLENAGVPIPGETTLLAAGFFASQGHFKLSIVMVVAATGAVLGDNAGYAIGRKLGRATLERYGRYIHLSPKLLAKFDQFFAHHGDKTILCARFITGLRVVAALLAGAANMRWRVFALYNFIGAVIWAIVITLVGFFFGHSWNTLHQWLGRAGFLALGLVILGGLIIWLRQRSKNKAEEVEISPPG